MGTHFDQKPPGRSLIGRIGSLLHAKSGAAAVEFAIVGPAFVMMLLGICSYGGYFWLAHSVQELANDGAHAAVAGLSSTERQQLAQSMVSGESGSYAALTPAKLTVTEAEQNNAMTVSVSYDASGSAFWAFKLVPMPSSTIQRSATIAVGGF